jgi:peptidoglycan/LPS O-acetylase OafA/YrhL
MDHPIDVQTLSESLSQRNHFDYLDGWRGVAISLLLAGHFFPVRGINLGTLGVNFFFVLSGYLMTGLLFVQRTPIDIFYRRRIARIVPAHIAFVASITLLLALSGGTISAPETLAAVFFVNNYFGSEPGQSIMPFGHIWSLSVEEHSYVLLSILAIAARKRIANAALGIGVMAMGCAICAFGYSWYFKGPQLSFDLWLHTEVAGYGIFLSGLVLLSLRKRMTWIPPELAVPLLILIGITLHWWSVPIAVQQVFGVGALALAINLLPQSSPLLLSALTWRPLRFLGLWSFSLYIWQQPFYVWSRGGSAPISMGLLLTFIAALTSYYTVEQPARRYLNRTWGAKKAEILLAK